MTEGIKLPYASAISQGLVRTYSPAVASSVHPVTGSYTGTATDGYSVIELKSDGTTTPVYTSPAVSVSTGRHITLSKGDANDKSVTFTNADGSLYGGRAVLSVQYQSLEAICDGTNWYIPTESVAFVQVFSVGAFTFNGSGGSSTSRNVIVRRIGDFVEILIQPNITATTGTSSTTFTSATALPTWARPATNTQGVIYSSSGSALANFAGSAYVTISTGGIITFQRDPTGTAWPNSTASSGIANSSIRRSVITYYVGTGS